MLEMARNGWNGWKWLDMTGNGWIWLEWLEMFENQWKLLEMAGMDGRGLKWLFILCNSTL